MTLTLVNVGEPLSVALRDGPWNVLYDNLNDFGGGSVLIGMDTWVATIHRAALAARSVPKALRYTITVLLVALTISVQVAFEGTMVDRYPFLIFIPVVFVCGTLFDRGNGFLATVLSAAACAYFLLPTRHSLDVVETGDQAALILFIVIGFAISFVVEALHNGLAALAAEKEEARDTVRDRDLLLNELAHRTRNDFANVVTLLNLQSRSANPEAREALASAAERVQTIARVHRRLELHNDRVVVDTRAYIGELCADLRLSRLAMRPIALDCEVESHSISLEKAVPLGLIINESVTNASKHAFPEQRQGHITVHFQRVGLQYRLTIADNGVGSETVTNGGIGNRLMGMLAAQLNGDLSFEPMSPGMAVVVVIPVKTEK
ncbi:sensor histidine kinase [Hyphomicrobium sp. MC8b]|uniref:sensor histidine kinase n=1 Tax=Hyphomicrobium sp. MC8b TaxID=300273 RepID=UPI0039191135